MEKCIAREKKKDSKEVRTMVREGRGRYRRRRKQASVETTGRQLAPAWVSA